MTDPAHWATRIADARSRKVVYLSHCLLNENTRYLGGACSAGAVASVVRWCESQGVGMVQMPCPEQAAWGGVTKRHLLRLFGARGSLLFRLRRLLLPLAIAYTRARYARIARRVAREVHDYVTSGHDVVAIVGVDGSPSCGVAQKLHLARAVEGLAALPATADARQVNDIVLGTLVPGTGIYVELLRDELRRRGISVPVRAFDLPAEIQGRPVAPPVGDA